MKRFLILCWMLGTLIVFSGCKKDNLEDDLFKNPLTRYDLAVEGGINTYTANQYIRLSKPALDPDSVPTPIRNASVVVNDGRSDIVFYESQTPGVYHGFYQGANRGDANYNNAYKLTIKIGDKTYTAVDTLRQVVNIIDDFLPLSTREITDQKIEVNIPKHTFGYLNPNKWFIANAPLWNPSKFDQMNYYSYTHFLGSPNSLYPLNNLKRSFSLKPDEYVYLYKISLSEQYAQYLYSVFMETDWNGLFSGVPVNVESNVSGNAQGFFSVVDVDGRRYPAKEL